MAGALIESAIGNALSAVGTCWLMGAIGLPVSPWWCATCATAMFLYDLWEM